ncbi:MAG: hypothetical protein OEU92_12335 [Alphaproteobacteria bacterium]|nr:hypothetical protein [Alphaproteobacteria bacterium]
MEEVDEEPIFCFDRHRFVARDSISITEHAEVQRTILKADVVPAV